MVGERDFAGAGSAAAADQRLRGGGVMRLADGAIVHEGDAFGEQAEGGIDSSGFEGFGAAEWREDAGDALGEHGFAGSGGANHQDVVSAGGGDGDGALDGFLAADVGEIVWRG